MSAALLRIQVDADLPESLYGELSALAGACGWTVITDAVDSGDVVLRVFGCNGWHLGSLGSDARIRR